MAKSGGHAEGGTVRHWKFTYQRSYGKGKKASKYVNDYSFAAADLADAYRVFGTWIRGQPYGRYAISLVSWKEVEPEPPVEPADKEDNKMIIRKPESGFALPNEGEHVAKLIEFEDLGEQEDKYNPGQQTHRMQLIWQLEDGGKQFQWVKVSLHPSSTFYEIATALLQDNPPDEVEVESLIGKFAILELKQVQGQDGRSRSKVAGIRPTKFKGRNLPVPPPPQSKSQLVITDEDVPF